MRKNSQFIRFALLYYFYTKIISNNLTIRKKYNCLYYIKNKYKIKKSHKKQILEQGTTFSFNFHYTNILEHFIYTVESSYQNYIK